MASGPAKAGPYVHRAG